MELEDKSGVCRCLGWCGENFTSPDKTRIRYCDKCRSKRNNLSDSLSRAEKRAMGGAVAEPSEK